MISSRGLNYSITYRVKKSLTFVQQRQNEILMEQEWEESGIWTQDSVVLDQVITENQVFEQVLERIASLQKYVWNGIL